jgi:hypothetical protein
MILRFLKVVNMVSTSSSQRVPMTNEFNQIIFDDVVIQENLCFVGGIPIITKFAARQYSNEIRLEAAAFVRQMYQTSTLTLQMFVSAGGLNVLVEFLDEDYDEARNLVLIGVNGIWNVFELQVSSLNLDTSLAITNIRQRGQHQRTTSAASFLGVRSCILSR